MDGTSVIRLFAIAALCLASAPALAQAEGDFPATILCDPLPFPSGPARDVFRLTVGQGRASYARQIAGGGTETGSGLLNGRQLTLAGSGKGRGFSYTASYAGDVSGRGGTLTGSQTFTRPGKPVGRRCQVALGDGRE